MKKYLLWKRNYPLRWYVRWVGLREPHRDGTPNTILMVQEVMRLTGVGLGAAYEFVKEVK